MIGSVEFFGRRAWVANNYRRGRFEAWTTYSFPTQGSLLLREGWMEW
jgi:hypothetical protein